MTSFNITSGTTTANQTLAPGETGRVALGASLSVTSGSAVSFTRGDFDGSTANPTVDNAGTISGVSAGILVEFFETAEVYIRNTGSITAPNALAISAVGTFNTVVIDNAGVLSGGPTTVRLGFGNDMFVVRNGSSTNGTVEGFAGSDWLNYAAWTGTGVTVILDGSATGMQSNSNFENVYGSAQGDDLTGSGAANILVGLDGNDSLNGLAGNDTLWGASGNDTLLGGDNDDLFYGGTGGDSMLGGAGNDTFQVTEVSDTVVEEVDGGADAVFSTVSWTVTSGNIEGVYAVGVGLTLTGSSFDDVLVADASGSRLVGGGGDDTLFGQAGADMLMGGAGNDTIRGGAARTRWSAAPATTSWSAVARPIISSSMRRAGVTTRCSISCRGRTSWTCAAPARPAWAR